jgi:uncharacterized protein YkwD
MQSLPVLSCGMVLFAAGAVWSASTNEVALSKGPVSRDLCTSGAVEKEVLDELNLARTKPQEYATYLEKRLKDFVGNLTYRMEGQRIISKEGKKAVQEAIDFLKTVQPVGRIEESAGLARAARDHVEDIGPAGLVGHVGTDGSQPEDRIKRYGESQRVEGENVSFGPKSGRENIIQLIVDDGVPDRGHRKAMFEPGLTVAGIACGAHKVYERMCVIDFAGGFKEKK